MSGRRAKIEAFLKDRPDDAFLLYSLAMEEVSEGNDELAVERLDVVIDKDAKHAAAYLQKGLILSRLEKYEDARRTLEAGVSVAMSVGDSHAAGEMQGAIDALP